MERIIRLTWESERPRGCVRVARVSLTPGTMRHQGLHDHEFAEFMWIESGRAEHLVNGAAEILEAGDWRCLRPRDVHRVRSDGSGACAAVNVSFLPAAVADLARRYGDDWPWPPRGPVRGGRLSPLQRARLSDWLDILCTAAPRRLDLEGFLVDLARMLSAPAGSPRAAGLPLWLGEAIEVFADPLHLGGGVPALARLCGRSREHLNRVVRRAQGRRATDLVNAIRVDWVAAQLHASDAPLRTLVAASGLRNQTHFNRLFRAACGATPSAWRRAVRSAFPRTRMLNASPWL